MNTKKIVITSILLTFIKCPATTASFDHHWKHMQAEYKKLSLALAKNDIQEKEKKYVHPYWQTTKEEIKNFILATPERNFLANWDIGYNMVRRNMGPAQSYEICYLEHCISQATKDQLSLFMESDFGLLDKDCYQFNCSSNTLGHLFYAAKVLEHKQDVPLKIITEFGSGYGNLAHIFKSIIPDVTIFLIDLPEILAIQLLFLKGSMPTTEIILHTEIPAHFKESAIHLIPVHFFEQLSIKTDLFISTFALSESTQYIQEMTIKKNFFDAQMVYITGQIDGWGNLDFVSHPILINAVKEYCKTSICQPMHLILGDRISYEILGIK